ncbi:unnamed protein product [Ceratitis capitata]|uniref:(Mediterranean fruit fly) hypothetical protein n=1 Tax=Ceratitis capitata TaxID=7213 RepID=A0A811U7R0_CERCA|nr:unnamed protein product [Ceratitis capitata]
MSCDSIPKDSIIFDIIQYDNISPVLVVHFFGVMTFRGVYGLRQLDLSLLSQLWALNDSIQEFRTMLESQELEPDSYSPHSPTPSSYDSVSSDAEDDSTIAANTNNKRHKSGDGNKPKIITTQPKLTQRSNSSATERTSNGAPQRPSPPKPLDMSRPVPRMRSAPPPPPSNRKAAAPPRPT